METIKGKKGFGGILADFSAQSGIYDASETLLKEGFGILLWNNNPDSAYNDYFRYNDADYLYVKKALEKVDIIMPLGTISQNRDYLIFQKRKIRVVVVINCRSHCETP